MLDVIATPIKTDLVALLRDRRVVVVGSAPFDGGLPADVDVVIGVNGGVRAAMTRRGVDLWCVNAWPQTRSWDPAARALNVTMHRQAAERHVRTLVLLSRGDGAAEHTMRLLAQQGTSWDRVFEITATDREAIEWLAGVRSPSMKRYALSAGLFTTTLCAFAGAAHITQKGFSWTPGYAYATPSPVTNRGHNQGDRWALARLERRLGPRLVHPLTLPGPLRRAVLKETLTMTTKDQSAPPAPASLKVRAKKLVQYGTRRYRAGDVFLLRAASDFKKSQYEWVDPSTPEQATSPATAQREAQQAIRQRQSPSRLKPNAADPIDPVAPPTAATSKDVL